jgi:hypothetical protein
MRSAIRVLTVGLLVSLGAIATVSAQGKDPRIGVWKLNVAKSTFPNGNALQSMTRTYEDRGGGVVVYKQEGVDAQGVRGVLYTTYKLDGKDYPQASDFGRKEVTMIAQTLVDPYTVEATNKLDGKVTGGATQSVSKDGKTLTIKNKNGVIQVFEKQ